MIIPHSSTYLNKNHINSVNMTLSSKLLTKGKLNQKFTNLLSKTLELEFFDLTSSGTMAFFKILIALDVKKGDEILIPNFICHTLLGPIYQLGAIAVLYDNKKNSWMSDENEILKKVTSKTKVILINHTFGFINHSIHKLKLNLSNNIKIVEDCCHSISPSSKIGNFKISENSICSFYSFNSTKLISTGEGGAVGTNDSAFFDRISKINIGDNLSDFSCSLGIEQLKSLNYFIEKRREIAEKYIDGLFNFVKKIGNINESIFFRFPILVENNYKFLSHKNISFRLGVDELLHEKNGSPEMINSLSISRQIVSVPIYPGIKEKEVNYIIEETKKYC